MKDYFKENKFTLNLLYFYHQGNQYRGRGIMTWKPGIGFHLEAFLDDSIKPIEKVELGRISVTQEYNTCSIRMRPLNYDWAIVPDIHISENNKLNISYRRFSLDFENIIFCESVSSRRENLFWAGSALYESKNKLPLPDQVNTKIKINDEEIRVRLESSGISYEDEQGRKIIGNFIEDNKLKLHWKLPKALWSKSEAWRWSIAIQDALSIWFGETVWMLQREFIRGAQKVTEIRPRIDLTSLGLLAPFERTPLNQNNKQIFIKLADFLMRDQSKAEICRRIFLQLVEASNQNSGQAQELLVSTILEAVLRSVYDRPNTGKKDYKVGIGLRKLFENYFKSREWTDDVRQKVMREYSYLRDRNAHPDWLFKQGGNLSETEQVKTLDSMIFLSRFYGYIILTLAGLQDLKPHFPEPHQNWKAAATITRNLDIKQDLSTSDVLGDISGITQLSEKLKNAKTYHEKTMIWRSYKQSLD